MKTISNVSVVLVLFLVGAVIGVCLFVHFVADMIELVMPPVSAEVYSSVSVYAKHDGLQVGDATSRFYEDGSVDLQPTFNSQPAGLNE